MSPIVYVLAGVVLLVVVGVVIYAMRARQGSQVDERLTRYSGGGLDLVVPEDQQEVERSMVIADRLEKSVSERGFALNIAAQLKQSDLKLKVSFRRASEFCPA